LIVEQRVRVHYTRQLMATTFELILDGDRERGVLDDMAQDIFAEIRRLEELLSAYIPSSDVCWINENAARGPVPVHPDTFDVLELARRLWEETEGAFDITVGPLVKCWGFYRRQGAVPEKEALEAALERVGMEHVVLDPEALTVQFDRPGVEINLGAVGKGFAVARAAERLREWGVSAALVHAGRSTIYALGRPPVAEGWRIGLREQGDESPRIGSVLLRDQALATSGAYVQYFEAQGRRFCHVIDPRTGWPVSEERLSVAVIGRDAVVADALSTAFFVGGEQLARKWCADNGGGAVIVDKGPSGAAVVREINCTLEKEEVEDEEQSGAQSAGVS